MKLKFNRIKNLLEPKSILGMAVYLKKSGQLTVDFVQLEKNKDEIEIASTGSADKLKSFLENEKTAYAVCLSINGKGVISKKLKIGKEENKASILQRSLPNASLKDFYLFSHPYEEEQSWISLIRKEVFDSLLSQFSGSSSYIMSVTLGPFNLKIASDLSENKEIKIININEQEYYLSEKGIDSIKPKGEEVRNDNLTIDDTVLEGNQIIAFGNAMNYFIAGNISDDMPSQLHQQKEEYQSRKLFNIGLKVAAILIFTGLFVNFMFFDYYRKEYQESLDQLSAKTALSEELNALELKRNQLNTLFEKSGINRQTSISFYADQLASTIPSRMILNKMEINPVIEDQSGKESLQFKQQLLQLKGEVGESIILNDWIHNIKEKVWIKEVSILDFKRHPKTGVNEFELIIEIIS